MSVTTAGAPPRTNAVSPIGVRLRNDPAYQGYVLLRVWVRGCTDPVWD